MNRFKQMILLGYMSIASLSAAIITPALPQIQMQFHLSKGHLEWIISIFMLGYVFGQLIYAPLANRFGRLNALRVGFMINFIGLFLSLVACHLGNFQLLLIGRLITALGTASGLTCCIVLIHELLGHEQAKTALSHSLISFTLGIALAVAIGGLITQYLNWADTFWVLAGYSFLMFSATWLFSEPMKNSQPIHLTSIIKHYGHALKSFKLVLFALIVGFCSAVAYAYSAAAPLIAHHFLHLSPSEYGSWNLLNTLGMLFGGLWAARMMKTYAPKTLIAVGLLTILPCLASLMLFQMFNAHQPLWFFATTSCLFFFSSLIFPAASFFATTSITDKANASSMTSFLNMGSAMLSVIILGYLPFSQSWSFIALLVGYWLVTLLLLATAQILKWG